MSNHRCGTCTREFDSAQGLRMHKVRTHSGKKWSRYPKKGKGKGKGRRKKMPTVEMASMTLREAIAALEVKRDSYTEVIAMMRVMERGV